MNLYVGYFAMHGGMDPMGLVTFVHGPSVPPDPSGSFEGRIVSIGGVGYEIATATGFVAGHAQGDNYISGGGKLFDGQHPVNWAYDTPGDLIGNVFGQVAGIIDNLTGGLVASEDLNKATLAIPGPDYSNVQSPDDWEEIAYPGMSNPCK